MWANKIIVSQTYFIAIHAFYLIKSHAATTVFVVMSVLAKILIVHVLMIVISAKFASNLTVMAATTVMFAIYVIYVIVVKTVIAVKS